MNKDFINKLKELNLKSYQDSLKDYDDYKKGVGDWAKLTNGLFRWQERQYYNDKHIKNGEAKIINEMRDIR